MYRLAFALAIILAPIAQAQSWNLRPWDQQMTREEVVERIVGDEVLFMDGGVASYGSDGRYAYTYEGGRAFVGDYQIEEDGAICVAFDEGQTRCDKYVLHGDRLVMLTENGRRFPVAP